MSTTGWGAEHSVGGSAWPPPPPSSPSRYPPPPLPPPKRSRRETMRGIGAGAVFLVSVALRIWLRLAFGYDDDRSDRSPDVVASPFADTVSARTLAPGTCVDSAPVGYVQPVPCDHAHIAEIAAVFQFPSPPGGPYPSIVEVYRQSLDRCKTEFNRYTGTTPDQTPAGYFVYVPGESEWNMGERLVVCYATGRNGVTLTASVRRATP